MAAGNDKLFAQLCEVIGQPDLADNPLFRTNALRTEHVHALHDELERALAVRTSAEWLVAFEAAGIPCGPLNDVAAVVGDPHVQARRMIVDIDDPRVQPLRAAGNPIKSSAFEDLVARPPAPDLDEHRAALLDELGLA